ncbi:MAG: hypothetical protein S4CHLAM37_01950 [Chlamydiia bacterium]|nr:hypothetical protein [Chlamydiia bacterium]
MEELKLVPLGEETRATLAGRLWEGAERVNQILLVGALLGLIAASSVSNLCEYASDSFSENGYSNMSSYLEQCILF